MRNGVDSDRIRWVYQVTYHSGNGSVTLRFSPTICPYLGQLNSLFKSYQLKHVSSLKSVYSIRLYELLNQWITSGKRFINLDDLRDILQLEKKYVRFTDLRQWVIDPSVKEINKKTNLIVIFKAIKEGRKVISLSFTFSENEL